MSNNWDAFDDIIDQNEGGALSGPAFGGDGLRNHQNVNWQATPDGVVFQLNCQGCGRTKHMTVEWPEVLCLKFGVNPADAGRHIPNFTPSNWVFKGKEGTWAPQISCPNCVDPKTGMSSLRIYPNEPEKYMKVARRNEWVPAEFEKQVYHLCLQLRGGR